MATTPDLVSPKLAKLTDNVPFGDVWERPASPNAAAVTVSALIAMNRRDQFRAHLVRARDNGVTQEELTEAITQSAFYAGCPARSPRSAIAREVFQQK